MEGAPSTITIYGVNTINVWVSYARLKIPPPGRKKKQRFMRYADAAKEPRKPSKKAIEKESKQKREFRTSKDDGGVEWLRA